MRDLIRREAGTISIDPDLATVIETIARDVAASGLEQQGARIDAVLADLVTEINRALAAVRAERSAPLIHVGSDQITVPAGTVVKHVERDADGNIVTITERTVVD